ncbi:MAG: CPBP family intramembrane metalloprotease [Methylotenera sp.]|nr:CPBP family intramembrane metalloprotease [Methylotenera sp.]
MTTPSIHAYPQWQLLGTTIGGMSILTVLTITQFFIIGTWFAMHHKVPTPNDFANISNGNLFAIMIIITSTLCSTFTIAIIKLKRGSNIKHYLALHQPSQANILQWLGILAVVLLVSELFVYFSKNNAALQFILPIYQTAQPLWLLWVAVVIAAPLFEELFFRGFLFTGIASSALGKTSAVILTSAIWTAIHLQYDAFNMLVIFSIGIILGLARLRTNSISTPLIMHMVNNALSMLQVHFYLSF